MSKIIKFTTLSIIFLITFLYSLYSTTTFASAQTGNCSLGGMGGTDCGAINATCDDPTHVVNRNGCSNTSIPNCSDRQWFCEEPPTTGNACRWVYDGAESRFVCRSQLSCPSGQIPNSPCSSFTTSTTCLNATIASLRCVTPAGWNCNNPGMGAPFCSPCTSNCDYSGAQYSTCTTQCGISTGPGSIADPRCGPSGEGIDTAIGCIPVGSNQALAAFLLRWLMGIGGGIAFLMMVYAGIMIITSAGNPQRVAAGKELMTAAVSGVLLMVFSVFLLRFIGVNILSLPGF